MQAYNLLFDASCRDSNSLDCHVMRSKTSFTLWTRKKWPRWRGMSHKMSRRYNLIIVTVIGKHHARLPTVYTSHLIHRPALKIEIKGKVVVE